MSLLLPPAFPQFLQLLPYLLLTLALAGVLALYFTLKREIRAQVQRNRRVEAMLLRLQEAGHTAAQGSSARRATASRSAVEEADPVVFATTSPRPGMNLNRRVQALRLLRRGEDLGHIAGALGVPRCEVELLVRVHRMAMAALANGGSPPSALDGPARPQSALTEVS